MIADGASPAALTVLGCDGSWVGAGGAGSGYLVRMGSTHLVLDLGPGTFAQLQRCIAPERVDALVLTHRHADHWSDLSVFASYLRFARPGLRPLRVFAPEGLASYAHSIEHPALVWETVADGDEVMVGETTIRFFATDHPVETLAVRIDGRGRTLGYSADTGPDWPLTSFGTDLDLVLCEATFTQQYEGTAGHLSGRQAGAAARAARARRLVITHRWPTIEAAAVVAEASVTFGAPVEYATMLKEYHL